MEAPEEQSAPDVAHETTEQTAQPTTHEIGSRTYVVANVEPLDVAGVRTTLIGTVAWLVAFLALLPFYGRLADDGRGWWLWTCLTGCGLGLLGLEYCRRRRHDRVGEGAAVTAAVGGSTDSAPR